VPSHDITREFMPILNDPFSFTSFARFIKCFLSMKLTTFCSGPVLCILSNISSFVTALMRFTRCSLNIKIVVFCSFFAGEIIAFSILFFIPLRALHTHPSYHVPFVRRKTRVSLGLQDPVVLRDHILQVDHAYIHGVG
jgi:hypothetical protein